MSSTDINTRNRAPVTCGFEIKIEITIPPKMIDYELYIADYVHTSTSDCTSE